MARLAGSVHGVVVQMSTETLRPLERRERAPSSRERCRRSAETRRRSRARCAARTRPRLRPARCGACTSAPASCPCRPCRLDELAERADDRRLVVEVHRHVGVVPQSPRMPRRLKSSRWMSTYFSRVRAAGAAELGGAHLRASSGPARDRPAARSAGRGSPSPGRRAHRSPACCAT